jgi:hypothetical protein
MTESRTADRPHLAGVAAGVVAWVLGYALTYLAVAREVRASALNRIIDVLGGEPATYELVGWVFYNAHFVDTVFRDVPLLGTRATSFVGGEGGFSTALVAVPAGVLLAGGVGVALFAAAATASDGLAAGLTLVPGYAVASVAGALAFEVTVGGASAAPDPLAAVLVAGLLYPAVCAGAGGLLGALVGSRGRRDVEESRAVR